MRRCICVHVCIVSLCVKCLGAYVCVAQLRWLAVERRGQEELTSLEALIWCKGGGER